MTAHITWIPATTEDMLAISKECPKEDEMAKLLALLVGAISFGVKNDGYAPMREALRALAQKVIPAHQGGASEKELVKMWGDKMFTSERWEIACPDRWWVQDALMAFDRAKREWC